MDIWQTDAFKRWWEMDWSWDGLTSKALMPSLGHGPDSNYGNLQSLWSEEAGHLVGFAGRNWTRAHLPPCDPNGNPCPADIFGPAKRAARAGIQAKLAAAQKLDKFWLPKNALSSISHFADLRGVVFDRRLDQPGEPFVAHAGAAIFLEGITLDKSDVVAVFNLALFARGASFERTKFAGASFAGVQFLRGAVFVAAEFDCDISFKRARFAQTTYFDALQVTGNAHFDEAQFADVVWFGGARFAGTASFCDVQFATRAHFPSAKFHKSVSFHVPRHGASRDFPGEMEFRAAQFGIDQGDAADFGGRRFCAATDFSGAKVSGPLLFHAAELHPETTLTQDVFDIRLAARRATELWFADPKRKSEPRARFYWRRFVYFGRFAFRLRWPGMAPLRRHVDETMLRHELALRTLRLQFAQQQNTEYEMTFYALELDARRARGSIPIVEALFTWLYKVSSDYGGSLLRPLLCLFGITLAGAALLTIFQAQGWPAFFANLGLALELQTSLPAPSNPGMAASAMVNSGPLIALHYILTLTTVGLVAVFLIALRRRFHISRS